jgi:hypothetical protein
MYCQKKETLPYHKWQGWALVYPLAIAFSDASIAPQVAALGPTLYPLSIIHKYIILLVYVARPYARRWAHGSF